MEFYGLSGAGLADKIDVQRSSISHILSGRNKPSLDFIMKVLSAFPDVDLYWLLNGKGTFPSSAPKSEPASRPTLSDLKIENQSAVSDDIERIVIFYKDGSFRNFENN